CGKLIFPVLGEPFTQALGKMRITRLASTGGQGEAGRWVLAYGGLVLPLCDETQRKLDGLGSKLGQRSAIADTVREQHYRIVYWKDTKKTINYRRFFEVNSLIGIRQEDPEVFELTHRKLIDVLNKAGVEGVRIDHPDGLLIPKQYLERLRAEFKGEYLVVEKILAEGEPLPDWPVDGTTGYDFMRDLNAVFVHAQGWRRLLGLFRDFTARPLPTVSRAKEKVIRQLFQGDLRRLAHEFDVEENSDFMRLIERYLVKLKVYRTYFSGSETPDAASLRAVAETGDDFLKLVDFGGGLQTGKLEQFEPAVMAKGVEDTFFYRFNALISLCEVGGDPTVPGRGVTGFHAGNAERLRRVPRTMLASSTHDTKLSEDVRARLNVLSEIPDEWGKAVKKWAKMNRRHKEKGLPNPSDEYRFYQVLLGTYTGMNASYEQRLVDYMLKSIREAKVHTSWLYPDARYEEATERFVRNCLRNDAFIESFTPLWKKVALCGSLNSLSQIVLKLTSPGVPDTYQGNETLTYRMVDPDNRTKVDFNLLAGQLEKALRRKPEDMLDDVLSGDLKLYTTAKLLNLKKSAPSLFEDYKPIAASGPRSDQVVAFSRNGLITVTSRFFASMSFPPTGECWANTYIRAQGNFTDVFTGRRFSFKGQADMGDVFRILPFSVLVHERHK
ncbi:MAG: malto-oligosyltrehalose synthase, partial [Thermoprotei archaeon]